MGRLGGVTGRINEEDIAVIRQRARIEDIIGSYVMLKHAGGGTWKGLCPFHDEKTPSFTVSPARGFYYCFGCGEGGDVITFVQRHLNLAFVEAVQHLADQTGVQLRMSDDGRPSLPAGQRIQILQANAAAEEFFMAQLASPEALPARQFLDGRGFDRAAAEHFRVGYAPRGGRALYQHLRGRGFGDAVLKAAGLIRDGGRDFFTGRVLWPIRDSGKSVLGFGARRLYEDDRLPAKYLNTPETPVYKKSQVLYGLDLARQPIGKKSQAVVVEGYTDVMAAHLAGVDTAVASCGTAFGEEHARLLQRLMGNHDVFHGEVIFTFDGDQAGQAAALKVFKGDRNFISQTYVAIEPTGLDPCDLRLQSGDAAVRELVARRVPLYRFVMTNVLAGYDLDRADGRLAALREAANLLTSIRDSSLVSEYLRELAGMVGMDIEEARREVGRERSRSRRAAPLPEDPQPQPDGELPWPDPAERGLLIERDTLKLMLQHPGLFDAAWDGVRAEDFRHPAYRQVFTTLERTGYHEGWLDDVRAGAASDIERQLIVALTVEPVWRDDPDRSYAAAYSARLRLVRVMGEVEQVRSRLQRMDPVADPASYRQTFERLLELELARKELQAQSIGSPD
ncbi:MAG: DNA primase [Propionibacteriaceae bacterium]|nr:DNA primase [Propionibacteriaceae bacterium]